MYVRFYNYPIKQPDRRAIVRSHRESHTYIMLLTSLVFVSTSIFHVLHTYFQLYFYCHFQASLFTSDSNSNFLLAL
jgi:hypothetical protein